jgi:hypothetical protein
MSQVMNFRYNQMVSCWILLLPVVIIFSSAAAFAGWWRSCVDRLAGVATTAPPRQPAAGWLACRQAQRRCFPRCLGYRSAIFPDLYRYYCASRILGSLDPRHKSLKLYLPSSQDATCATALPSHCFIMAFVKALAQRLAATSSCRATLNFAQHSALPTCATFSRLSLRLFFAFVPTAAGFFNNAGLKMRC